MIFQGNYLRVLSPRTSDGTTVITEDGQVVYKETHLPLTAKSALETANKFLPPHLRKVIEVVTNTNKIDFETEAQVSDLEKKIAELEKKNAELQQKYTQATTPAQTAPPAGGNGSASDTDSILNGGAAKTTPAATTQASKTVANATAK